MEWADSEHQTIRSVVSLFSFLKLVVVRMRSVRRSKTAVSGPQALQQAGFANRHQRWKRGQSAVELRASPVDRQVGFERPLGRPIKSDKSGDRRLTASRHVFHCRVNGERFVRKNSKKYPEPRSARSAQPRVSEARGYRPRLQTFAVLPSGASGGRAERLGDFVCGSREVRAVADQRLGLTAGVQDGRMVAAPEVIANLLQ